MSARIKSIDFLRGLCMVWMICGHLSEWWLLQSVFDNINTDTWNIFYIFDFLGASGFLFISGVGITLSYRINYTKSIQSQDFNFKKYRFKYFTRILLLFLISLTYNSIVAIGEDDPSKMWIWFILQTLSFSLLISWSILKINKYYKIIVAIIFFIINEIIWFYVVDYNQLYNTPGGVIYYILYNNPTLSPILQFFPIYMVGSFLGDLIYENIIIKPQNEDISNSMFIKKFTLPLISIGLILVIISISIYPEHPFPPYFKPRESSWIIYSIGALVFLYTLFLTVERFQIINIKSKYRFFYYYSFYSFTTFILQLVLEPLFLKKLNIIWFIIAVPTTILLIGLFLRLLYFTLGKYASIRNAISFVSSYLADLFYKKDKKEEI